MKRYIVTEDADMLAPEWLAARINYASIKFVYCIIDGAKKLKGVSIHGQIAKIGDTISFDGKRLSVEKNIIFQNAIKLFFERKGINMDKRPMELKDTVEMMNSEDYKERFRAEYCQTVIRYGKLKNMLDRWDEGELNFAPTCPRSTYNMQIRAMADYIAVLEARAVMEGVDLSN